MPSTAANVRLTFFTRDGVALTEIFNFDDRHVASSF